MRNLTAADGAGTGGSSDKATAGSQPPSPDAADWWDGFAKAVEDPKISTYDYLKDSLLQSLELDGVNGFGDLLTKAQRKALKELLELTDPRELRETIRRFEKNTLLFDSRTRVMIKCAGALLDTYLKARDEYDADVAQRVAQGEAAPSEAERKEQIERIVGEKLAEPGVAQSIEQMAQVLTGKDKEDIRHTVEQASKELREQSNLSKMTNDIVGISRKYFTLDNVITVGVCALPLVTWQYKWALAAVFGAYVSRLSVYHGYKALAATVKREPETAREEGQKALAALKAAGGNVLAIGISPLVGKLPAAAAGFATFATSYTYNKTIDVSQKLLRKKDESGEDGPKEKPKGFWGHVKKFFSDNTDSLVSLAAGAAKEGAPSELTKNFEHASKRLPVSKVSGVAKGLWNVGGALTRRFNYEARRLLGFEPKVKESPSPVQDAFSNAAKGEQEPGPGPVTEASPAQGADKPTLTRQP